jgi:hypothetical protein
VAVAIVAVGVVQLARVTREIERLDAAVAADHRLA